MSNGELDRTFIDGPAGRLEVALETSGDPRFRCVVAHPHPLYGGSMDNAVTQILSESLAQAGGLVLRFNFRGVGRSQGTHDDGRGEIRDLLAIERFLQNQAPTLEPWLAGYSFGAAVVLRRAEFQSDSSPQRMIVLAPPVTHYDFSFLEQLPLRLALICGEQDALTPVSQIRSAEQRWGGVAVCEWLPGAGHDLGTAGNTGRALRQAIARCILALS